MQAYPELDQLACMEDPLMCFCRHMPSGRLDALIDMGNPMKGIVVFPYLERWSDGRALRAVGPEQHVELSRTVARIVYPPCWPTEVRLSYFEYHSCLNVVIA